MIIATVLILIPVTVVLMLSANNNSRKNISDDVSANGNPSGVDGVGGPGFNLLRRRSAKSG